MEGKNVISELSQDFAVRIVRLFKYLKDVKLEPKLAEQVLRSGTSIGANIAESTHAQSRKDFINKLCIALKEADETKYWLMLFHRTNFIDDIQYNSLNEDCRRIIGTLVKIINTTKRNTEMKG